MVADIHLSPTAQQKNALFFNFLSGIGVAHSLYILGDLFDRWLGDDDAGSYIDQCVAALARFHQLGIPLFIQRGNRDFMLGTQWFSKTHSTPLPDWHVIKSGEQFFLLTHGDLLVDSPAYLNARAKWTNPVVKFLAYQLLPLSARDKIYRHLSGKSDGGTVIATPSPQKIRQKLQQHRCGTMIYGHFHQPHLSALSPLSALSAEGNDAPSLTHCCLPHWQSDKGGYGTLENGELAVHSYP